MTKPRDLTNQRFGLLTAILRVENNKHGKAMWLCRCDCGSEKPVLSAKLVTGETRSCGCATAGFIRKKNTKHGLAGSRPWSVYYNMLRRCYNPNTIGFHRYGGRGITVCDRWRDSFAAFLEDMGEPPEGMSLDRIDNDKGYSPENCRWATKKQQIDNSTRPKLITFNGETRNISEWARKLGIGQPTLQERLQKWSVEEALSCGKSHRFSRRKLSHN